jgi:hypothetical protein
VILLVALMMVPILGMVGIALDSGYLFVTRRSMQTAADSAALAGSFDQANNSSTSLTTVTTAAKADAKTNGFDDADSDVTVTVHSPPTSGAFQDPDYVEVIVEKDVPAVFMNVLSLIGVSEPGSSTVKARAVAGRASIKACFVAMNASASSAFFVSGGATINTPNCGIFVNSSSSTALRSGSSGLCVSNLMTAVVGGKSLACTFSPTPIPGAGASTDPLAGLAVPTRPSGACINVPPSGVLDPTQAYCKIDISGGGNTTLSLKAGATSNVIYIDGQGGGGGVTGFSVSGSGTNVTGSGIMFYVASGDISADPNSKLTLSGPTTGTYAGMVFFQASGNTLKATLKGSGNSNCKAINGIFYAVSAEIDFLAGGAHESGSCSTNAIFIADTISINGGFTIGAPTVIPTTFGKSHLVE